MFLRRRQNYRRGGSWRLKAREKKRKKRHTLTRKHPKDASCFSDDFADFSCAGTDPSEEFLGIGITLKYGLHRDMFTGTTEAVEDLTSSIIPLGGTDTPVSMSGAGPPRSTHTQDDTNPPGTLLPSCTHASSIFRDRAVDRLRPSTGYNRWIEIRIAPSTLSSDATAKTTSSSCVG